MSKLSKLICHPILFFKDAINKINAFGNQDATDFEYKLIKQKLSGQSISECINGISEFEYKGAYYVSNINALYLFLVYASILNKVTVYNKDCKVVLNIEKKDKNMLKVFLFKSKYVNVEIYDYKETLLAYRIELVNSDAEHINPKSKTILNIKIQDIDELKRQRYDFPVDVVYTYVDSRDKKWQAAWKEYFGEQSFDPDRYATHQELKYSLRSINQYIPWVNKIYVVTNCSKPDWLNSSPRVTWVDHKEIFPDPNDLPTFNSHAIEATLHRIKGLSENFIYFNDDIFINCPLHKSFFYVHKGMSINSCENYEIAFWSKKTLSELPEISYQQASRNVQDLLERDFGYIPRHLMEHAPYTLLKSVLFEMEDRYPEYFKAVRSHKRRSSDDLNTTSFFYPHYAMLTGHSLHVSRDYRLVRDTNYDSTLKNFHKYIFLCFNTWEDNNHDFVNTVNTFFSGRFPIKPEWEN